MVVLLDEEQVNKAKFFLYLDVGSGYRWVLRSDGKRISESGQAYDKRADCERDMQATKQQYPDAMVRDLTR